MPALDAALAGQVKTLLGNLTQPIQLVSSLDERPKSGELADLLDEIESMSDQVTHVRDDEAATDGRKPSFAIRRVDASGQPVQVNGEPVQVRFGGIPLGHEFSSLVLALLQVGGHPIKESADVLARITALPGTHRVETYMSLTCQNCPTVVQAFNAISVTNPRIEHIAIEGSLFQDEIDERQIMAVPTVYVDGELWGSGRMEIEEILDKLDTSEDSAERKAAELDSHEPYDVLVVGGGPAGATAAVYAARKGIRTGIAAERFGGQVLDTNAIENLTSVLYTEGPKLAADLEEQVHKYDVEIVKSVAAQAITPGTDGQPTTVEFQGGGQLKGKTVILATGARWRTMGVPGEEEYRNKGVTFCPHCDGPLFKGKRIAVVGGGNSGIEAAIDLAGVVDHVTVLEFLDTLKADAVLIRKLHSLPNVDVIMSAATKEVVGDGAHVTGLRYEDRTTGEVHDLDVAGIFVQIGLLPNTEWLRGSAVELSDRGEIVVDEHGRTSVPGVFAAGDCTTTPFKQIVVAFGAGSTAALSAFDHLIRTSAPAEELVSA